MNSAGTRGSPSCPSEKCRRAWAARTYGKLDSGGMIFPIGTCWTFLPGFWAGPENSPTFQPRSGGLGSPGAGGGLGDAPRRHPGDLPPPRPRPPPRPGLGRRESRSWSGMGRGGGGRLPRASGSRSAMTAASGRGGPRGSGGGGGLGDPRRGLIPAARLSHPPPVTSLRADECASATSPRAPPAAPTPPSPPGSGGRGGSRWRGS